MTDLLDVTGVWYGKWSAESRLVKPNAFIAHLQENHGRIGGTITEPNLQQEGIHRADIDGMRSGADVQFVEQYDGTGRLSHSVDYSGQVDSSGTSITGTWSLQRYSGGFVMTREQFSTDELEDEREEELAIC
jgi:hypothetical protein